MKKRLIALLLAALLTGCLSACGGKACTAAATVEGALFGGKADDRIAVTMTFDRDWLTKRSNERYNPELAEFCALLSADSYFRAKDLDKKSQNRVLTDGADPAAYEPTSLLSAAGFTGTEHFESYKVQTDPEDSNDSVTLNIGHMTADGKYDVYAVVIRGCFSAGEWRSAFDPGCSDTAYETLTGAHPDWTNKAHHKGADVAANRARAYIEDFMARTGDPALPDRLLLTGHSRGGGIANILGAYFEKKEGVTSYTYTFNAMAVTQAEDAKSYRTVFNVFDSGDLFTDIFPFMAEGFVRYGTDKALAAGSSKKLLKALAGLKGRDDYACVSAEAAERYRDLFAEHLPDREALCGMAMLTRSFGTKEEAEAARTRTLSLIGAEAGLGLESLCRVGEVTEQEGRFGFAFEYCGAALLQTYAMILAYGEAAGAGAAELFAGNEAVCEIAALLQENAAGLTGGHLIVNSYVIAGQMK